MTIEPCPLCHGDDLTAVYRPRGTARDIIVHVCAGCGLVQSLPRRASGVKRPARISGGADWGNLRYGKGFRAADTMAALASVLDDRPPASILDIGSNRGVFLLAARARWPDATITAIEPDARVIAEYASIAGLTLHNAPVEAVELAAAGFDLIHCSHTLEHLADPVAVLGAVANALTPDGVAYLEVPNLATIGRSDLVEEWFIDKHLHHFSSATLAAALARAGLRPVRPAVETMHLCTIVRRETDLATLSGDDPSEVARLIAAYDQTLGENQSALRAAADRITELASGRRVAIWGAGRILDSLVSIGGLDLSTVIAVVDRHLVHHVDQIHGAPLRPPSALPTLAVDLVVIMSREFADEIAVEARQLLPAAGQVGYAQLLTPSTAIPALATIR